MNNLKSYDEFINEEINFDKLINRVKIEFKIGQIKLLIYVMRGIFFWLRGFGERMKNYEMDVDTLKQIIIFINKYEPQLTRLLDTKDENNIKAYLEVMCTRHLLI